MLTFYKNEIAPLIQIYKDIDRRGLLVDQEQRDRLISKYSMYYDSNLLILQRIVNNPKFNPRSPTQVGVLIYESMKYPKKSKVSDLGRRSYKTDKDTLDDLVINHTKENEKVKKEILNRIITCKKLYKVLEYLRTPLHPDGRFRCSYNITGTETGRTSASKTIDMGFGENIKDGAKQLGRSFQTLTKHGFHVDEDIFNDIESSTIAHDIRSIFVPSPGCVFLEMDGSGAEARVVAVLSEDWHLLETFDIPPNVHARTAAQIFDNIETKDITKDRPTVPGIGVAYYHIGKTVRHASNLGVGPFTISQRTHLPIQDATLKMHKFHEANPNIRNVFHKAVIDALRDPKRLLVSPQGRQRRFFDRLSEKVYRQGFAQIPQSTVGDHTKFTMRRVIEERKDVWFVAEMHDGLMAEVPKDNYEEISKVFKKHYERDIDFKSCTLSREYKLIIPCEIEVAKENWMNLEEVKL